MKKKNEETKLSLASYMEKNTIKSFNSKNAKSFVVLFATTVGLVIALCLFFIVLKLFEIHEIAGYVGIGLSVLIFIFLYIVPVVKIRSLSYFHVKDIKYANYHKSVRKNRELRNKLANMVIDISANTDANWYSEDKVGKLAIAKQTNDYEKIKEVLSDIYATDVKKISNQIILEHAVKTGIITGLSQSEVLDTAFVAIYELDLIKQLVFLYGFRPSEFELAKIYKAVLVNSFISYGTQSAATSIIGKITSASGISFISSIIGTLATAVSQGLINSALTVSIGFQTKKYLTEEYKLSEVLENVSLTEEDKISEEALLKEVKTELENESKKKKEINDK